MRLFIPLLAALLSLCIVSVTHADASHVMGAIKNAQTTHAAVTEQATSTAETTVVEAAKAAAAPKTNAEIRQWYNDQVAVIPAQNDVWIAEGLSAEARARKAYDIRHHARIKAREMMPNKEEVANLQARDMEKYGNPDGPTFEYLVAKNQAKGLEGDAVYEAIVGSAKRTNEKYNKQFGAKSASDMAKEAAEHPTTQPAAQ